ADDTIPTIMPNEMSSSEARQNWARLIQKIYEVDPLVCPKCQGQMKIISIIDDFGIIDKILKHLNLWDIRNHDPSEIEPVYIPLKIQITRDLQVMIIQAPRFQYLTPFGADIFNLKVTRKIALRDYRCPILKFSHNLIFPVCFNNKYSSQPMSIFLSK
ncbi:MAG: hypothetical protein K8S13_17990, partial [Desulfobacula sp.]|nr:hypothetical protein [Desulfobacula sp.]